MFPRFERRNYQEDLLSKVTGHRCKTKVESAFMWWADGEMTCRVLLSSIYVGVGRLGDPTLLYTGAYLQPIKKNRQGVGSILKIHRPAGMKQKIGIQNVMQVDENYVRYEAGLISVCWQLKYFYGNWRRTLFIASSHFISNHNQVKKIITGRTYVDVNNPFWYGARQLRGDVFVDCHQLLWKYNDEKVIRIKTHHGLYTRKGFRFVSFSERKRARFTEKSPFPLLWLLFLPPMNKMMVP